MTLVVRRREPRDQTKAIPYQDLEAALVPKRHQTCERKTLWRMLYETAARAGEILAPSTSRIMDLAPQTSGDHRQRRPQRIRVLGVGHRSSSLPIPGRDDAEDRCSSPNGNPTSSPPGETNAHTLAGEDCPINAPPPYSNKPPWWVDTPPTAPLLAYPPR